MKDDDSTPKVEWLSMLNEVTDELFQLSDHAGYFAEAARVIGLEPVSKFLKHVQKRADEMRLKVSRASGIVTEHMVNDAQRNTHTLVEAVLAGVTIAKREP